jgi:hypothetical protein
VSWLPDHTRRLADRMLSAYCQRICPPEFREQVVLGYRLGDRDVTLHEVRRICGVPGTARLVDVAQLRYDARRGAWRLYCRDPDSADDDAIVRWRRYPRTPDRSLAALVRELDADPYGLFWPRINGASLRWCTSRGRCAGCTERYLSVLGAETAEPTAAVTVPFTLSRGTG